MNKVDIPRIYCGQVTEKNTEQIISLFGWVNSSRDHGGIIFIDLRDISGICQLVFDPQLSAEVYQTANQLRSEFSIEVVGKVTKRSPETINKNIPTGKIEIIVQKIKILSASKPLPFSIDGSETVHEQTRLTYRYLDLRNTKLQQNIILRSRLNHSIRNFLTDQKFIEIETPLLNKSTPEGARDFLIPARLSKGLFYALPQSPQIYKQLLMISGFDRYFQIARCFRDEDLRGNRQPEFTQLDLEMSFCSQQQIQQLTENLLQKTFKLLFDTEIETPIPQISYDQAIADYGLDAPDVRYDLKLQDISTLLVDTDFKIFKQALQIGTINCLVVQNGDKLLSRKDLDEFTKFVGIYKLKGLAWAKVNKDGWQSPIAKFISNETQLKINQQTKAVEGDIILFAADKQEIVKTALGNLRKQIAKKLNLFTQKMSWCWITDFPLMQYNDENKRWESSHHPFTRPNIDNPDLLNIENIGNIKAHCYDLVLNGVEVGGGSLRIYDRQQQNKIFELLGISPQEAQNKFGFLLDALEYGAPPHGGIALGLDRLLMEVNGGDSIRDYIAFPKTQMGACLMSSAPSEVSQQQLTELGLKQIANNKPLL